MTKAEQYIEDLHKQEDTLYELAKELDLEEAFVNGLANEIAFVIKGWDIVAAIQKHKSQFQKYVKEH
tara:strand:- start:193 stop:393 length:201 start_codon:yes stop_codon:yes gene_type:complete